MNFSYFLLSGLLSIPSTAGDEVNQAMDFFTQLKDAAGKILFSDQVIPEEAETMTRLVRDVKTSLTQIVLNFRDNHEFDRSTSCQWASDFHFLTEATLEILENTIEQN